MRTLVEVATAVAAVGCGLMAGIFFAFSVFLMRAFDQVAPEGAVGVMQAINRTIITPLFLLLFLGAGVASLVAAIAAVLTADVDAGPRAATVVAAACYLVGALVVTGVANVPRNDALDALDVATVDGAAWSAYRGPWTAWNHVRTVASVAATVLLVIALG